jgi:Uma2 family endonuclease
MSGILAQKEHVKKQHDTTMRCDIPPLEGGDRLTREEFERRYNAMLHLKKAELIAGRVYMPAAVSKDHGSAHSEIITWFGTYWAATPMVKVYDNTTVRLDESNELQPDALLRVESGSVESEEGSYIEHLPELVVEVTGSSASYDLHDKLEVYRRNGIREYLVWQLYENHLDWFQLVEGQYVPLQPDENGTIRSHAFPGLWLAVEALPAGDMAELLAVVQQGIQTKKHAVFVQRLNEQSE